MPRRRMPPRLYLREDERVWIIRDGPRDIRTGSSEGDRRGAEEALRNYLSDRFTPSVRERDPDQLTVAEVLTAYGRERAPHVRDPVRIGNAIFWLADWWAARRISEVRGANCRAYADWRREARISDGTIRRELGVLSAAIRHWHREHGPLVSIPVVTLPDAPEPHPNWLTRSEAARLLAGALGWYQETWCDIATRQEHRRWRRNPFRIHRHAARFILLGLYTGTRSGAIASLRWMPNTTGGWVDLERGVIHRRGIGESETNKRRPPAKVGARLLAHLRRWKRLDDAARDRAARQAGAPVALFLSVVSYEGEPVLKVRRAWESAVELGHLGPHVTPHILRHTRATWMMQAGVEVWEAAGHLGMSPRMLQDVYGHHHPDFQSKAAEV